MTFHVPESRKHLRHNRFEFTVNGSSTYDIPLLTHAPVASAEAYEQGKSVTAVLLACDSDAARDALGQLDAEQFRVFVEAWHEASGVAGVREDGVGAVRP